MFILKKEQGYRKLFFAGIVNGVGDRFSQVAVLSLLLTMTGSGLAVGSALAVRIIPYLLFSNVGGFLADRFSKNKIMLITDLSRILFALSFLLVHTQADLWIVYTSLFFLSIGEAIYQPVRRAVIVDIMDKKDLAKINSIEQVMQGIVLVVGSFSGGIVAYFIGAEYAFVINGCSFLIAAGLVTGIKGTNPKKTMDGLRGTILENFKSIYIIIKSSRILKTLILVDTFIPIADGMFNVLISVYAVKVFHLQEYGVGLFYSGLGLGLCLNLLLINKLKKSFMKIGVIAIIGEGFFQLLMSQQTYLLVGVSFLILISFVGGIGNTCLETVFMEHLPTESKGAVIGFSSMLSNVVLGLSMLFTGFLLEFLSASTVGLIGGGLFCLTGVSLWFFIKQPNSFLNEVNENA